MQPSKLSTCLALVIAFVSFFYTIESMAKPKYTSAESFIKDQTNIRIVTDAAAGFGNQTASYNLIVRLRQMGYQGSFEFIYPNEATDKITTLFDLPKDIADDYKDEKRNIRFIKLKNYITAYNNKTAELVTLGMSGADGAANVCLVAKSEGADVNNIDAATCKNYAKLFNTQVFAKLSPFIYQAEERTWPSKFDTEIYLHDQTESQSQIGSDSTFITMPVADLTQTKNYLKNDPRGQELLSQKPALKTLIDTIENKTVNVMPVYGYTLQMLGICSDFYKTESDCLFAKLSNMLEVIAGARFAQLFDLQHLQKPLIIPVFYNYTKEADGLTQLIDGKLWKSITLPEAKPAARMIEALGLRHHFSTANIDDPSAIRQIQTLKHGQILLLSVGPLPKVVFDGIYTHTGDNVWPQIREGANSFNSLILTGKPHFRCAGSEGWEIGFDLVKDARLKNQLQNFYNYQNGFCRSEAWQNTHNSAVINLGKFIMEANNPHSSLSNYFTQLKATALKPENDRIQFALTGVIALLDK